MSEAVETGPTTSDEAPAQESQPAEIDWKAKAREWERRAKENRSAADELQKLREAQQTAEERAKAREAEAEKRAREAESRALRREIALENNLSREDAELLDDLTDEDAMRRLAARIARAAEPPSPRQPRPNLNQGGSGQAPPQTPADEFAGFLRNQLK